MCANSSETKKKSSKLWQTLVAHITYQGVSGAEPGEALVTLGLPSGRWVSGSHARPDPTVAMGPTRQVTHLQRW